MALYKQAQRWLSIATPLAEDELKLASFHGVDAVSRLFRFDLDLFSENDSIDFAAVVGQPVTLKVQLADDTLRYFHGHLARFVQSGRSENFITYRAEMVPWLWFLTRTADCRIFQQKKVPEIIEKIFKDLGYADFSLRLRGSYEPRDYCVQYRETDFNFVSRLMEEEGIFYFFEHQDGKHILVLADSPAEIKPVPEQPTAQCDTSPGGWRDHDVVLSCALEEEFRPGAFAHTDYNFETPSTNLMANVAGKNKFEIYDYPGEYMQAGLGDQLARIRLEEQRAVTVKLRGDSNCRAFTSGYKFKLADHYRTDLNQEYLLTSVQHSASVGLNYSSGAGEEARYTNSFEGIPATQPYRPPRVTPQPLMQGCQTAVVVGPAGEEIYTDKYGRVKVQFHWDREGKKDQNSSCWVRVSSPWAGKGWGGLQVPRIGQEVIIDFLEGDPDQPLIVGRVYNAGQMPPFGLPGGAVISGFKSNSTKGGGGYNQISLDDTKGNELLHIHAQYDQDNKVLHDERTSVGNDRTESVGHDETITIGHDRKEKVGNNEDIAIGVNRTETVGSNETITIGVNRTESVGSNETISIGSNRTETVGASETVTIALMRTHNVGINDMLNVGAANEVTVGGLQAITVGATRAVTVGSSQTVTIASDHTVSIGSKQETTTGSDFNTTVGAKENRDVSSDRTTNIGGKDTLDVGKSLHITAADEIVLETGASKITMKKNGKIEISGMNITIKGTTSIKEEAVSITIEASGINTIKGSLVKIN